MASKRHQRRKMCDGKKKHNTKKEASVEKMRLYKNAGSSARLSAYKCPFCRKYHVGHNAGKKNKRRFEYWSTR